MCKVAGVTGVTNENREDVWLFLIALGDLMSRGNSDGIGYAAFDSKNNIFGERWLINNTWFRDLSKDKRIKPHMLQNIYNFFGEKVKRDDAKTIILHTRAATCGRGLKNTHPFVDDFDKPNVALIHNGVIHNEFQFKKLHSTCDSEVILTQYMNKKVKDNVTNLSSVTKKLQGWFTCMVLAKDKDDKPVFDIFTDNGRLASYFIPQLKVRIYSSDENDIRRAAEILGLNVTGLKRIDAETFLRLDVETGEITHEGEIEVYKQSYSGYPNVTHARGNFDDENFVANWLGQRTGRGWRGHHDF